MQKRLIRTGNIILDERDKLEIQKVLDSGRLSEGPKVTEFERQWARYIGSKHAVCTSSGFGALMVAFAALKVLYNLSDGTEVITTPLTYFADFSAIYWNRLKPVFIDVNLNNFCMDEVKLKEYLFKSKSTTGKRILLTVDLFGYMNNIDNIKGLCEENNLIFFEDAAEAHGSSYNRHRAGSQAEVSIFSFYIAHNIQVGEMGAINTNNSDIASLSRSLKAQGRNCRCETCMREKGFCPGVNDYGIGNSKLDDSDPRFTHDLLGFNFKTTEFQAAIGISQLKKADDIFKQRARNVKYLNVGLSKFKHIFDLPHYHENVSYMAYPIVIKDKKKIQRKWLREQLSEYGIENRPVFGSIPNHQPAAQRIFGNSYSGVLPNADFLSENGFYIGCHQHLQKEDLDYVIESFERILEGIK